MADRAHVFEFGTDDLTGVVAAVDEVRTAQTGWVNLAPMVPEEQRRRPPSILGRVFSARGPEAPMATITPGRRRRDGSIGPSSIGLVHPLRERLRPWLAEHGLRPPPDWRLKQDNPMRGAVWEVPADTPTAPVVAHLMAMAEALDPATTEGADPHPTWMAEINL
jgi:hypothetical protein